MLHSYRVDRIKLIPGLVLDDLPGRGDVTAHPGDYLLTSLKWQAGQTLDQNYVVFVHLLDADGRSWAGHDNQPNGDLQATSSWVPGQSVSDRFLLKLPDDTPPGMYRLEVGMYHIDLGYHFLSLASGGNSVLFGSVKVQPRAPVSAASAVARWSGPIALRDWRASQQASDVVLNFNWLAGGQINQDYTLFVHLVDSSGKVITQADSPPEQGLFRTGLWDAGDVIPDQHTLKAPPPGSYRLLVGWYRAGTAERLPLSNGGDTLDLGEVQVR